MGMQLKHLNNRPASNFTFFLMLLFPFRLANNANKTVREHKDQITDTSKRANTTGTQIHQDMVLLGKQWDSARKPEEGRKNSLL